MMSDTGFAGKCPCCGENMYYIEYLGPYCNNCGNTDNGK